MIQKKLKKQLRHLLFPKRIQLPAQANRSYLSFTFDDFPKSAAHTGSEILQQFDAQGTFYVSMGLQEKEAYGKKMFDLKDLKAVYENGHEIGCHSYSHSDLNGLEKKQADQEFRANRLAVQNLIKGAELRSFAYPKGRFNVLAKKHVNAEYSSGRSTKTGLNQGIFDANMLLANKLYSNSIPIERQFNLIDEHIKTPSWLIFYTHDVESSPSEFGCDPDYFRQVVEYANASGTTILPVGEVIRQLQTSIP